VLYEEGKLKLDDPVSKYIPEFKGLKVVADPDAEEIMQVPAKREMSVRDLLRHTSGLTYGIFGNTAVDKLYRKSIELLPKRLKRPPMNPRRCSTRKVQSANTQ